MGKLLGMGLIMSGITGYLYQWQKQKRKRRERVAAFILFLHKTRFTMDTENVKIAYLLESYQTKERILQETLSEIAKRLKLNIYPKGESVWEEVFKEKEQNWNVDSETFGLILQAGNGFFGKNRAENICFLEKSIHMLEEQERNNKKKDAQERKVWIPVGMLGGVMLVILFV